MKNNFILNLSGLGLLLLLSGCSSSRVSNAPVHAAYLGETTTFEGNSSLRVGNYGSAKKIVKGALLSNGFKLVSEDNLNKQVVGRRKVDEEFPPRGSDTLVAATDSFDLSCLFRDEVLFSKVHASHQ